MRWLARLAKEDTPERRQNLISVLCRLYFH